MKWCNGSTNDCDSFSLGSNPGFMPCVIGGLVNATGLSRKTAAKVDAQDQPFEFHEKPVLSGIGGSIPSSRMMKKRKESWGAFGILPKEKKKRLPV